MHPPDVPDAAPSYAELFAEGCFGQRSLVAAGPLREAAIKRGMYLPLFPRRECLEPLDRAGGFSPVGFLQTNYTPESTWLHPDPQEMVWREERHFEPWDRHGWKFDVDDHVHVSERYSPWQLLYLADALEGWDPQVSLGHLQAPAPDIAAFARAQRQAADARLRALDVQWRPVVKLLVSLQTRLWPYRVGRTTQLTDPLDTIRGRIDPLRRAVANFDAGTLVRRFELSLDDLAQLHAVFAAAGRRLDPVPRWYRLAEAAPRRVTDEARGDALRARDCYDAAYLLRGLYYLATERWLPRADELDDYRTVAEHRRRHLPRRDQPGPWQRQDLKALLLREGLYPHRIHFFVEGATEKIILERLLPFLGYALPGSGMTVTDIHGVDQAERHALVFRSATEVAARTVLIADREGSLGKTLMRLRADGLFPDEKDVLLWERDGRSIDFEEANFTASEILRAIGTAARRRRRDLQLDLTVAELRSEQAARTLSKRPPPALTKLALRLAEDRGIRVSKPELAVVFADKLIREIRRAGHLTVAAKRRPLLARLWYWLANQ